MSNWAIKIKGKMCRTPQEVDSVLHGLSVNEAEFEDYSDQLINIANNTDVTAVDALHIQTIIFTKFIQ